MNKTKPVHILLTKIGEHTCPLQYLGFHLFHPQYERHMKLVIPGESTGMFSQFHKESSAISVMAKKKHNLKFELIHKKIGTTLNENVQQQ